MTTDFTKPVVTDAYATLLPGIVTAINDLARGLEPTLTGTSTNIPTGAIRWNAATNLWERYNGASWAALAASYAISITGSAGSATTATNLAGGVAGGVPYQTGAGTTGQLGAGVAGAVLTSGGSGAPTWTAQSALVAAWGNVSGKPTTVAGYGISDMSSQSVANATNASGAISLFNANAGIHVPSTEMININDANHGMIYTGTVDGPQFRGFAGFMWSTGTAGANESMRLTSLGLNLFSGSYIGSGAGLTGTASSLNAGIGVGQTRQNVTASRAASTTYTNGTSKPIFVNVGLNTTTTCTLVANVGGVNMSGSSHVSGGINAISFIVLPGEQYSVVNSSGTSVVNNWTEIR